MRCLRLVRRRSFLAGDRISRRLFPDTPPRQRRLITRRPAWFRSCISSGSENARAAISVACDQRLSRTFLEAKALAHDRHSFVTVFSSSQADADLLSALTSTQRRSWQAPLLPERPCRRWYTSHGYCCTQRFLDPDEMHDRKHGAVFWIISLLCRARVGKEARDMAGLAGEK